MMGNKDIIQKTIDHIENNLDSPLNLDEISKEAGYSKFHLNRVFLECVGCTIHKYIQMRRLTVAAEKLVYTEKPIIQIACEANYSSQQSFAFAFRGIYGQPPQVYRAIKIHTPKLNRFSLKSNLVECEALAA